MIKKILLPLTACFFLSQCSKSDFDDLSGPDTIKGVVIIYDTLNGSTNLLAGKSSKVYLKYTDSTNFIYSTTTDATGQYKFSGIDHSKKYSVYTSSDTGVVKYFGQLDYTNLSSNDDTPDTLKLYPSFINYNGIHLMVRDVQGGVIPNTTAWVFNSPVLFAADTSAGKAFDITTNTYGTGNRFNLTAGNYYIRIKTKIGNLDMVGEASIAVQPTGLHNMLLTIGTTPLPRNGIEIKVEDVFATPVNKAEIYAYRSFVDFSRDTSTFSNSLFRMISNPSGLASTYLIEPGTYYLRAIKVINIKDTLKDKKTIIVNAGIITKDGMTVR